MVTFTIDKSYNHFPLFQVTDKPLKAAWYQYNENFLTCSFQITRKFWPMTKVEI